MPRPYHLLTLVAVGLLLPGAHGALAVGPPPAPAEVTSEGPADGLLSQPTYEIRRFTIDTGGGGVSGGPFVAAGTMGQWDLGVRTGSRFIVSGGFWPDLSALFLDGFETGDTSAWSSTVSQVLFIDGFETGNTSRWSSTVP